MKRDFQNYSGSLKLRPQKTVGAVVVFVATLVGVGCALFEKKPTVDQSALAYFEAMTIARESGLSPDVQRRMVDACDLGSRAACLTSGKLKPQDVAKSLSILQGYTNGTSTQLNVVASQSQELQFYLWDLKSNRLVAPIQAQVVTRSGSDWAVHLLAYQGLTVGNEFRIDVISFGGELVDSRLLTALSPDLSKAKVAVASCMNDHHEAQASQKIWAAMAATQPNLFLFIGDNVYADWNLPGGANPDQLWRRNVEARNTIPFYRWTRLVPTLAIWDDHDFGKNDGDRTYPFREESASIFRLFFPQEPDGAVLRQGPGIARVYRAFGQKFMLLDDRYFRAPAKSAANEETLFGAEQEKWILAELEADMQPAWMISGIQWFGGYHSFESYEGSHPESFKNFKKELRSLRRPMWFVSGDRHLAELMEISSAEIGARTWELTTSGIHSKMYPGRWKEKPNPRQVEGVDEQLNFAVVETQRTGQGAKLNLRVLGAEGQKLFERNIEVRR
jgi:alkaline phosphatase D